MLVAETGGVRVQTTSPAMGSASIRLQGLYGRYTQLLSDGLPLYGGQTASIGLLQIPPTDLANVEIIKGSASSMYGGSALGGVINLMSRTPGDEFEGEVLANVTSKDGQDLTTYLATPLTDAVSGSVTAGLHHQAQKDLDNDGWLDFAGYDRATIRPRLYWEGAHDEQLYVTYGVMEEQRSGGAPADFRQSDNAQSATFAGGVYEINQDSKRQDLGFVYEQPLTADLELNLRGSGMKQEHQHQYGSAPDVAVFESDQHESYLLESSITGFNDIGAWVIGAAFQSEQYHSDTYSEFDYSYDVPAIFSQVDLDATDEIAISLSARADWHSEYGTQLSPRISVLYQPNDWTVRGAFGKGFYAPTPFIEDIEAVGLSRLDRLNNLEEEQATTSSIDISYSRGVFESSVTLFASNIDNVTELTTVNSAQNKAPARLQIVNAPGQSQIRGAELLLRYRWHDIKLTGSYLFTDATREVMTQTESNSMAQLDRVPLALTPKHSAGFVAMWEEHGSHLVGFEAYYTGTQKLEGNPYRTESKPYWHLGLLGQITLGKVSYFINFENLLNVRQTKEDPLVLPEQSITGRWTTDIWSRNDGFTVNAGIRFKFGH